MTRLAIAYAVAGLAMLSAPVLAQNPPVPAPNPAARRGFEKFTVEGQPVDRRAPELDTDHPVFPGQTRAPYHKTVDVQVTTIASDLNVPWAVELLPSGRFLITEKAGRLRILNKDGSTLHTITANMPPVYFRGQAGLLDVALDKNFASNHRIFFVYLRTVDAQNCAHAVDSAILDENAGTISNVTTIFQAAPFTNRAVSQSGSRIAVDPDGNLFVAVGDRSTGDPLPLQAQHLDTYLGKVIHITPDGKPAPGNPSLGLPEFWSMGHRTPQGLARQRADQGTRFPLGEQIALVEGQRRRSDHRVPVVARLLHAWLLHNSVADLRPGVVDAVHDHRPAVVLALLDDVQLVTAPRAVLHFPQPAVGREGQPLRRPVSHGPRARQPQRRIAGRRLALGRDVNHLAQIGVQVLRLQREWIAR